MLVLVTYDVSTITGIGRKRLKNVAKICVNYGIRVQKSVFECNVAPYQWEQVKNQLLHTYDPDEDSLRFYYLGSNWKRRIEHYGLSNPIEHDEPLII